MLLAAHISRAGTLTEWMDGSILDEREPHRKDPELDLYDPDNPNQPPYSDEFLEKSNADGLACAADISVPVLVVNNGADDACTPSHARRLYAAVPHTDKEFHEIAGATHYYLGQGDKLAEAVATCSDWIDR